MRTAKAQERARVAVITLVVKKQDSVGEMCSDNVSFFCFVSFLFLFCYIFTSASVGCLGLSETLSVKKIRLTKKKEKKRGGGGGGEWGGGVGGGGWRSGSCKNSMSARTVTRKGDKRNVSENKGHNDPNGQGRRA